MASPRNDINTPTISSGAANGVPKDLDAMTLHELFDEKDRLEGELKELSDVLKSNNADMNTPLLTPDGFPRSDIDVAQIRTTRARIIRLRNDYKGVMDRVEKGIHEHFARAREQGATVATPTPANASTASATLTNGTPSISTSQPQEDPSAPTFTPPFAKINSVAPNSPAETAGLQQGDKICVFGDATYLNHDNLRRLASVVQQNRGVAFTIVIERGAAGATTERKNLMLTPRNDWGGQGLLGCHIVPLR